MKIWNDRFPMTLILGAFLISAAPTAASVDLFKISQTLKDSETQTSLFFMGHKIGSLSTIGPGALILEQFPLKNDKGLSLLAIRFIAGSGGTHTFSYVEKIAVVQTNEKKPEKSKIHFEFLYKIRREKGLRLLITLTRSYKWDPKNLSLALPEFDEETANSFVWNGKTFEPEVKDPNLELEEN